VGNDLKDYDDLDSRFSEQEPGRLREALSRGLRLEHDFKDYGNLNGRYTRQNSGRLRSAMIASQRLGSDLKNLLRGLHVKQRRY